MCSIIAGTIIGSPFFWIFVSIALIGAGALTLSAIIDRRTNKMLVEPVSEGQKQILYSAAQLEAVKNLLADTGYAYDWRQNIFYSVRNPWQRKLGYCSLYDDTAALLGMVIDCEPIDFEYDGKKWRIELWKGQYGLTTGAEIGVYTTTGPDLEIPGVFDGTFYFCADDSDNLSMTYTLLKNNKVLFNRAAKHWWLTGFVLGIYSKPSELTMEVSITFKDFEMRERFIGALRAIGYTDREIRYSGSTVLILFTKPHARQPVTQKGLVGRIAAQKNKRLVAQYRRLIKNMRNMYDILTFLRKKSPYLYGRVMRLGRPEEVYRQHDVMKRYLD